MLTIPFLSFWLLLFGWTAGVLMMLRLQSRAQHRPALALALIHK